MPVVKLRPRDQRMELIAEKRDSAGRNEHQIWAMEQNQVKPPRLRDEDRLYAEQVQEEHKEWPKVFYHLADTPKFLPDGRPDPAFPIRFVADRVNPNYPMPYELAVENGYQGQIVGSGTTRAINVVHPYKTCFVPTNWDPIFPVEIDESECKKQEAKLLKDGWTANVNDLKKTEAVHAT